MANLTYVELITPERVLFSGEAEAVVLRATELTRLFSRTTWTTSAPSTSASCGSRASRPAGPRAAEPGPRAAAPVSGAPAAPRTPGEPTVGEVRAALHGGFVKVADNKVSIVAGVAELAEEIDVDRAQRALEAAEGRLSAGDVAEAEAALARARVRIEAAVKLKADLSRL